MRAAPRIARLQQDGRASIRSVAERVHVSRANAYARISRM
ncbi:AsnC family protein, partial [Kitasatospora aureofaciens]